MEIGDLRTIANIASNTSFEYNLPAFQVLEKTNVKLN